MAGADADGYGAMVIRKYVDYAYVGQIFESDIQLHLGGVWYFGQLAFIDIPGCSDGQVVTYQLGYAVSAQSNYPYARNAKINFAIFRR
jgi:hypothetical protein